MIIAIPAPTPVPIHFHLSLLVFVGGGVVNTAVDVVEEGLTRASTRDMFAPMAVSMSDLYVITMSTSVL